MNGTDLLIDSNIVIYFLLGRPEVQEYFLDFRPSLSFISELEILSGSNFKASDYEKAESLISKYPVIEYLPEMKNIVIDIRSQKKLKLPDVIIAATAIYYHIPLVSADKGFNGIKGLNFIYHEPNLS